MFELTNVTTLRIKEVQNDGEFVSKWTRKMTRSKLAVEGEARPLNVYSKTKSSHFTASC